MAANVVFMGPKVRKWSVTILITRHSALLCSAENFLMVNNDWILLQLVADHGAALPVVDGVFHDG